MALSYKDLTLCLRLATANCRKLSKQVGKLLKAKSQLTERVKSLEEIITQHTAGEKSVEIDYNQYLECSQRFKR